MKSYSRVKAPTADCIKPSSVRCRSTGTLLQCKPVAGPADQGNKVSVIRYTADLCKVALIACARFVTAPQRQNGGVPGHFHDLQGSPVHIQMLFLYYDLHIRNSVLFFYCMDKVDCFKGGQVIRTIAEISILYVLWR